MRSSSTGSTRTRARCENEHHRRARGPVGDEDAAHGHRRSAADADVHAVRQTPTGSSSPSGTPRPARRRPHAPFDPAADEPELRVEPRRHPGRDRDHVGRLSSDPASRTTATTPTCGPITPTSGRRCWRCSASTTTTPTTARARRQARCRRSAPSALHSSDATFGARRRVRAAERAVRAVRHGARSGVDEGASRANSTRRHRSTSTTENDDHLADRRSATSWSPDQGARSTRPRSRPARESTTTRSRRRRCIDHADGLLHERGGL